MTRRGHATVMVMAFCPPDVGVTRPQCLIGLSGSRLVPSSLGVRVQLRGTRRIAVSDLNAILEFLRQEQDKEAPAAALTWVDAVTWINTRAADEVTRFKSGGGYVGFVTCGPKDLLYLPSGFAACHEVIAHEDVIGVRFGCRHSHDLEGMKRVLRMAEETQKENVVMKALVDELVQQIELAAKKVSSVRVYGVRLDLMCVAFASSAFTFAF